MYTERRVMFTLGTSEYIFQAKKVEINYGLAG